MSRIESLPPEILHNILQWVSHDDMATLPRVSRTFHSFIKGNKRLYKYVYLNNLDDPDQGDLDWEKEIHDLIKLHAICHAKDTAKKKPHLGFVYDTITRLLKNAKPNGDHLGFSNTHLSSHNADLIHQLFLEESNIEAFLQRSFLFKRVRNEVHHPIRYNEVPKDLHQQSAKLHCLYGRPVLQVGRLRSSKTYPYACSKVYDLRQYTERTRWGPFMNDGSERVDWEKVEAIMVVLGHNVRKYHLTTRVFQEVWDSPFSGSWSKSSLSQILPSPHCERHKLAHKDPYGITGTWYRIVCFLDYNAFFSYNFPIGDLIAPDTPRPAIDVDEATRLIVMRIYVTNIEPPGPNDGQELPVVHFRGISSSLDDSMDENANSAIRGIVRLTKEGEVRWTTWSIFHGQERWRSEGIQIGGVQSARGVLGSWFESDYDPHGPVGPTAFWKAADDDEITRFPSSLWFPHHHGLGLVDDSDMESWMEDDVDDEEIADELDDLLAEADMNVEDVVQTYVDHHLDI